MFPIARLAMRRPRAVPWEELAEELPVPLRNHGEYHRQEAHIIKHFSGHLFLCLTLHVGPSNQLLHCIGPYIFRQKRLVKQPHTTIFDRFAILMIKVMGRC